MKVITCFSFCILGSILCFSQDIKTNEYDKFLKKQRIEMATVPLSGLGAKNKLSFDFSAIGSSFFVTLNGSGWGASTVDAGNELILLFANDSTATLHSTSLQSFEPGEAFNAYSHRYVVSANDLLSLSKYPLSGIRKYSFSSFTDLAVPKENSEKIKRASAMFAAEIQKAGLFKSFKQIELRDIRNYVGDSVAFCTRIYNTRYFKGSPDGPTLLDVQANFSDPFVNVLILEKDRAKFSNAPEKRYLNKEVCISGMVELRNNVPSVIVANKEQIRLKSPVTLSEIGYFSGDTVTVTGKIVSTSYLSDSADKPTLLSMNAPGAAEPFTLFIQSDDRPGFGTPEADYLNKIVQVRGKVEQGQDKVRMVLHNKQQIEIVDDPGTELAFVSLQSNTASKPDPVAAPAEPPAEKLAEFPGGSAALLDYVAKNLTLPTELSSKEHKRVVAGFLIDEKGACKEIKIIESAGYLFDEEVKALLLKMPKWKPATVKGVAKASRITLPVTFRETDGETPRSN